MREFGQELDGALSPFLMTKRSSRVDITVGPQEDRRYSPEWVYSRKKISAQKI
jgi:hypothetical protein